jgi:RNA polymerase sigma factor (sigma-70 family)
VLDLLERGDRDGALALLMKVYGDAVYAFCLQIVKNAALAEDVCQCVFLQVHDGLAGFVGDSSLRTWLFCIARYRAVDAFRASRREAARLLPADAFADEPADATPDPAESLDAARAKEALLACLDCLPAYDRKLVLVRYCDGLSYEEMGVVLGQKPDTLRARVARTLPKLLRCLVRKGIEF